MIEQFQTYLKVARVHVLFMPIFLIFNALSYTRYKYHVSHTISFIFVGISILLYNLATNSLSEYRDYKKGVDDTYSSGTKYRLASGIISDNNMLLFARLMFLLGSITGILALVCGSKYLFIPGIMGAGMVIAYSEKPFELKYKALSELCVFFVYGILIFTSCIMALTDTIRIDDIVYSIPFGLLTANVVLANNIRDFEFEKGKTLTIPIKYGLKLSYGLLFFITHIAFLCVPIFVYCDIVPKIWFITLITYPIIFISIVKINSPKFINVFGVLQVSFTIIGTIAFFLAEFLE